MKVSQNKVDRRFLVERKKMKVSQKKVDRWFLVERKMNVSRNKVDSF